MGGLVVEVGGATCLPHGIGHPRLGPRVGSLSATSERLKRLLDSGMITGFHARLDPALAGRSIEALVDVRIGPSATVF